jgi:AcrR family transcriptional regulator
VQARSRATIERILEAAAEAFAQNGVEATTMSEIARRADVVIGSLYQYFSDKPEILKELMTRHYAEVREMLREGLSDVRDLAGLVAALQTMSAAYFKRHRTDPLFRALWSGVQTNAELQAMDVQDTLTNAQIAFDVARPLFRKVDEAALMATCALLMQEALTASRFALAVPKPLGKQMLGVYQRICESAIIGLEQGGRR